MPSQDNKDNIKLYLVWSFWISILLFLLSFGINEELAIVYFIIEFGGIIFCFVNSIRYLKKYKNETKWFAVMALIFSGVLLVLMIISFLVGFIIGLIGEAI